MTGQRERIATAFARAPDYEGHARVQRSVAVRLAERIAALDLPQSPRVLEIGCGTGFLTRALVAAGIGGDWTITDIAPEMVERCRANLGDAPSRRFATMDGEFGTPEGGPFDLICSSLALQWFTDAPAALARMAEWLAPGGHCLVTTLGPRTFAEWREAHAAEGLVAGTPEFRPVEDFTRLAPAALDIEALVESHADARAFLRSLKAIGAGTSSPRHRPLPPGVLRKVMTRFEQSGSAVTYEVVTCHLHRAR
ncbi:methyltransferase domain-containing protein [Novosphingobium sp. KN65.2]|uniref:methyltransferase domain-containing protein n=1 Tax=Novosphingobium sp. KN65.2 TaxID=1478134 RepID=UPI0005E93120|nr:methyltransferase domain-containing protein [Novosphingobium sp. KN65.2]CDO36271.1 Methyltransferase type 11 [Novosphingobium sp. KN65.2]